MTDIEINELSIEVITSIAEDLRVAYYDKVGGTLTIEWGVEQSINAYADSNSNPESSPNHKIIFIDLKNNTNEFKNYYDDFIEDLSSSLLL